VAKSQQAAGERGARRVFVLKGDVNGRRRSIASVKMWKISRKPARLKDCMYGVGKVTRGGDFGRSRSEEGVIGFGSAAAKQGRGKALAASSRQRVVSKGEFVGVAWSTKDNRGSEKVGYNTVFGAGRVKARREESRPAEFSGEENRNFPTIDRGWQEASGDA